MIDTDGTIKVADLGLARSIGAVSEGHDEEEVVGTPNYMSPEQVHGVPDLDCRADIYSTGAMLYHMLTGHMMFEEFDSDVVMEKQAAGHVCDMLELNPKLSMSACWFVEKLLSRRRESRYGHWKEVLSDIGRVRKHLMLHGEEPKNGASVVIRSKRRTKPPSTVYNVPSTKEKKAPRSIAPWIVLGILLVAVIAVAIHYGRPRPVVRPAPPPVSAGTGGAPPAISQETAEGRARKIFSLTDQWVRRNPSEYDEAVSRFEIVADKTVGTKYSLMALDRIKRIKENKLLAEQETLKSVCAKADALANEGRFQEAMAVCRDYNGSFKEATAEGRHAKAAEISELERALQRAESEKARIKQQKLSALMASVAGKIVEDDSATARHSVSEAMTDADLADCKRDLMSLETLLAELEMLSAKVVKSFAAQIGRTVHVVLKTESGPVEKQLKIAAVEGSVIRCKERIAREIYTHEKEIAIGFSDLSPEEVKSRARGTSAEAMAIHVAVTCIQADDHEGATAALGGVRESLGAALSSAISKKQSSGADAEAREGLVAMMRTVGFPFESYDADAWGDAMAERQFVGAQVNRIETAIATYREAYGATDFGQGDAERVLAQLEQRLVASRPMTATEQPVQMDIGKLQEAMRVTNPHVFAGEIRAYQQEGADGYFIEIHSRRFSNVNGLAAFAAHIVGLDLSGTGVRDLGGLAGMQLQSFKCHNTEVQHLAALADMPLLELDLNSTAVKDLSFLAHTAKTLRDLNLHKTEVTDLTPLKGMQLTSLNLSQTKVRDLAPLAGNPIRELDLSGNARIKDLAPLGLMPIQKLDIRGTDVDNLWQLVKFPLVELNFDERLSDAEKNTAIFRQIRTLREVNGNSIHKWHTDRSQRIRR